MVDPTSTEDKLRSKNPATRKEGEQEATAGDIIRAARKQAQQTGQNELDVIRSISERVVNTQSSGGKGPTTSGNEAVKITSDSGKTEYILNPDQETAQAVAESLAEKKRIEAVKAEQLRQQYLYKQQQKNKKNGTSSNGRTDRDNIWSSNVSNRNVVLDKSSNQISAAEETKEIGQKLSKKSSELEYKRQFLETNPLIKQAYGVSSLILGSASGVINVIRHPIKTIKGIFSLGKGLATDPYGTGYSIGKQIQQEPSKFIGEQVGTYYGFKSLFETVPKYTKNLYVKVGAKEVPAEQVFAESVLSGKERLPTTKSTAESLQRFEQTKKPVPVQKKVGQKYVTISEAEAQQLPFKVPEKYYISTASDAPIKGKEAGIGKKAAKGYEDPGIYVTPKGEGSPYFLRLSPDMTTEYSFNILENLKQKFSVPTVTEFQAEAVKQYPRSVIAKPGFEAVAEFQQKQAGSGSIFITKRSEIGQGTVQRQKFLNPVTGRYETELGTSEIEAVIPYKQEFQAQEAQTVLGKVKGFEEYTMFEGQAVAIRKAELVTKETGLKIAEEPRIISTKKIAAEQRALSYQLSKSKTPIVILPKSSIKGSSEGVSILNSVLPSQSPTKSSGGRSRPSSQVSKSDSSANIISEISSPISSGGSSKQNSSSGTSSLTGLGSSIPSGGNNTPPVPRNDTPPPIKPSSQPRKKSQKGGQLFEVQVRRGGMFTTIAKTAELKQAVLLGRRKVEGTAAASFRIRGIGQQTDVQKIRSLLPQKKFRESKKEVGVFIQKRRFRISSFGEKGEITSKGLFAIQSKKRGKSLWG